MDYSKQRDKTIVLKEKDKVRQFFIENIVYVKCDGYVSTVHLNNGDKPEFFEIILKEIEEVVNGFGFYRINRNTLVNLKYFKSFVAGQKRCFVLKNGIQMKISRRKWCVFKKKMKMEDTAYLEKHTAY